MQHPSTRKNSPGIFLGMPYAFLWHPSESSAPHSFPWCPSKINKYVCQLLALEYIKKLRYVKNYIRIRFLKKSCYCVRQSSVCACVRVCVRPCFLMSCFSFVRSHLGSCRCLKPVFAAPLLTRELQIMEIAALSSAQSTQILEIAAFLSAQSPKNPGN